MPTSALPHNKLLAEKMTLKPNYLRAAGTMYLCIALFTAAVFGGVWLQSLSVDVWPLIGITLLVGTLYALFVCLMFVPRELSYDASGFSCRMLLQGNIAFRWDDFIGYRYGRGVLVLRFDGSQMIQLSGFALRSRDWKAFKAFLNGTFPEKQIVYSIDLIRPARKQ